jgi:hypothetical protein
VASLDRIEWKINRKLCRWNFVLGMHTKTFHIGSSFLFVFHQSTLNSVVKGRVARDSDSLVFHVFEKLCNNGVIKVE